MQTLRQSMENQNLSSICDTFRNKQYSTQMQSSERKKEHSLPKEPSLMDMPSPSVLEKFTAGTNNGYQRNKFKLQLKLPVNLARNKTQQTVRKPVPQRQVSVA